MYQFASSTWTEESTERAKERFAQMTDEKLLKTLAACVYRSMPCGPRQVHESHPIQRDLVRQEIWRRGTGLALTW
jgi:hypothetical protein